MKRTTSSITFVAILALLTGCEQACQNEVAASLNSPSGKLQAVVFHRGCGATVGFNTQVSVIAAPGALSNEGGNVLILEGKVEPKIQWLSEGRLSIAGIGSEKAFKKEQSVLGIEVSYR